MSDRSSRNKSKTIVPTPTANNPDPYVFYRDFAEFGIFYCRLHINRMVSRGQFPAPQQLSPNRKVWRLSQIQEWKATRPLMQPH
jgi:hypothetical protein